MSENGLHHNNLKNGRKCIAVLSGYMSSYYHSNVVKGAIEACKELDYNLIVFMGGPINNPDKSEQTRDTIFNLINKEIIDGIIIPTGSHSRYISDEQLELFLKQFDPLPIVNLSGYLPDRTNVLVDFNTGIEDLINHYIDVHNFTKIAIIRGPKGHPTSDFRTDIYRRVLKKRGIEVNEKLIIYSDLLYTSAEEALKQLIDVNKAEFEAIMTINDNVANGVMSALKERGYRVPQDVAVSGSMNSPICKYTTPTLTSINESLHDLGKEAVKALHRQFMGGEPEYEVLVPSSLSIKESCGCGKGDKKYPINYIKNNSLNNKTFDEVRNRILNDTLGQCDVVFKKYGLIDGDKSFYDIFDFYKKAIESMDSKELLSSLKSILETMPNNNDLVFWLEIISELKTGLLKLIDIDKDNYSYHDIYFQIDLLKEKYNIYACESIEDEMITTVDNFRFLVNTLNSDFNLYSAKELILKALGSNDLFISVYNESIYNSTNLVAARNGEFFSLTDSEKTFDSINLIPNSIKPVNERYTYLIFPLSYKVEPIGFLMLDYSNKIGVSYENIQVIISTFLQNENQIKQLNDAKKSLTEYKDHLEEIVNERTMELQESLESLKTTQYMLIESEKIAALGSIVAGVAHQLNTPLGICVTLVSYIKELTNELMNNIDQDNLSKEQLLKYIDSTIESSNLTLSNLKKASSKIDQFKEVSVVYSQDEKRVFDLKNYLELIIENLVNKSDIKGYKIVFNCPERIKLNGYPGALNNIISQLIINSIDHGYHNRGFGEIIINVHKSEDSITISVKDFGEGIDQNDKASIFTPFFTTKSNQGKQGLGLNVVYNLVFQSFKGTINCRSTVDNSTEFIINLPI